MADQASGGLLSPFLLRRRLAAAGPWLRGRVLDVGCGGGALAALVPPDRYRGLDIDPASLALARARRPGHRFDPVRTPTDWGLEAAEAFDTVAMLAVIEHAPEPERLLERATACLAPGGRVVVTTPSPAFAWAHGVGARVGLFSAEAHEQHEAPIGPRRMAELAAGCRLRVACFRRFLGGSNQLFVLEAG